MRTIGLSHKINLRVNKEQAENRKHPVISRFPGASWKLKVRILEINEERQTNEKKKAVFNTAKLLKSSEFFNKKQQEYLDSN